MVLFARYLIQQIASSQLAMSQMSLLQLSALGYMAAASLIWKHCSIADKRDLAVGMVTLLSLLSRRSSMSPRAGCVLLHWLPLADSRHTLPMNMAAWAHVIGVLHSGRLNAMHFPMQHH